jgi:hypothetical protein
VDGRRAHGGGHAALRWVAGAVVALALGAALLVPPAAPAGPGYTAPRAAVARAADSALRARGVDPARWSRTLVTEEIGHPAERRFLRDTAGRVPAAALGRRLAGSYLIPAQWHARYVRRDGPPTARREEWSVLVYPDGRVRRVDHDVADDAPGASPTPAAARALAAAALRAGIAGPDAAVARLGETELAQQPRPRRLDTTIEYVDSATALPGGATARVVVRLAGDEAVRGGRIVRLPDAWTRRDADRQSRRSLAFGVSGLVVFAGLVALLVRGGRRAPVLPPVVTRRRAVLVGLAAGLVSLATSTNELAGVLAGWETQVPWSSFLGTTAVATVLGAAMAGLIAGVLWSGVDALRRRAGVPFFPASGRGGAAGAPAAARDALLLGAALGLAPVALQLLTPVLRTGAWPDAPTTTLDLMVPFAAQALRAVQSLAWAPAAALPVAALAAGVRTPRARLAALAAAALVLAVATAASSGGDGLGCDRCGERGRGHRARGTHGVGLRPSRRARLARGAAGGRGRPRRGSRALGRERDRRRGGPRGRGRGRGAARGALPLGSADAGRRRGAGGLTHEGARSTCRPRPLVRSAERLLRPAREERQAEVDADACSVVVEAVAEVRLGAHGDVRPVRDLHPEAEAGEDLVLVLRVATERDAGEPDERTGVRHRGAVRHVGDEPGRAEVIERPGLEQVVRLSWLALGLVVAESDGRLDRDARVVVEEEADAGTLRRQRDVDGRYVPEAEGRTGVGADLEGVGHLRYRSGVLSTGSRRSEHDRGQGNRNAGQVSLYGHVLVSKVLADHAARGWARVAVPSLRDPYHNRYAVAS